MLPFLSYSQKEDLSKKSKEELIQVINKKDIQIKELEKGTKKSDSDISNFKKELSNIKNTIKETNEIFLKDIFNNKYIVNTKYFKETDLSNEDDTKKFKNSNVLINSILADDSSSKEDKEVCNKALDFNTNYLILFEIRKTVLNEKFSTEKVEKAILDIKNLPVLEISSKLDESKKRISNALKNYNENTCLLKKSLDKFKNADQKSPALKQFYTALEKDDHYKEYPYLIHIIRKVKNNIIDYTNDDLQPCEEIIEKKTESNEKEKPQESKELGGIKQKDK